MKNNRKTMHMRRQILDEKLIPALDRTSLKSGWIRSVRFALGITTRQLASLMKVGLTSVNQMEAGEVKKSITLKNLFKAADAMDCEVIYMIVPKSQYNSFDDLLNKKAEDLAYKIARGVSHSMSLEQQKVSDKITKKQIENLAQELKKDLDPRLWISESKLKGKK